MGRVASPFGHGVYPFWPALFFYVMSVKVLEGTPSKSVTHRKRIDGFQVLRVVGNDEAFVLRSFEQLVRDG